MRQIVVRLAIGNAYQAEADDARWAHGVDRNGVTKSQVPVLQVVKNKEVVAEFPQHGVIGWWWQDGPVVLGK